MKFNYNGKHNRASLCKYLYVFISISFITLIIFAVFFKFGIIKELVISNQKTEEIYLSMKVEPTDRLGYKWINSFELIPWTAEFDILENNSLVHHTITVAGFGSVIPENK